MYVRDSYSFQLRNTLVTAIIVLYTQDLYYYALMIQQLFATMLIINCTENESSLTVERIMEETGITEQQLDMVLEDCDRQSIAECFDDVAIYLDQFELSPADRENVRQQHTAQAAMTAALKFWSRKNPYEATLRKLLAIIINQKRGDTAIKCVAKILESTERR